MSTETRTTATHVIFDLDGTIVNSVDIYINILRDYAKSYGKELSPEVERCIPNTTSIASLLKMFVDSLEMSEEIDITELRMKVFDDFYKMEFQLISGVDRLIKHLHKNNIPMAIATANTKRHFDKISQKFGNYFESGNYFSHSVCGWDDIEVVNKKPHPDVYLVCAKRFKNPPKDVRNVLIIEDSLTGVTGAVASGMQTALVKDRRIGFVDRNNNKIDCILESFNDFKPEFFGLPAFSE